DLAAGSPPSASVKVVLGAVTPTATVIDLPTGQSGVTAFPVVAGDFNGDGAPDLVGLTSGTGGSSPDAAIFLNQAGTRVLLTASPASAPLGQPVTLTATVGATFPSAGSPTGTVQFFDGQNQKQL